MRRGKSEKFQSLEVFQTRRRRLTGREMHFHVCFSGKPMVDCPTYYRSRIRTKEIKK